MWAVVKSRWSFLWTDTSASYVRRGVSVCFQKKGGLRLRIVNDPNGSLLTLMQIPFVVGRPSIDTVQVEQQFILQSRRV